MGQFVLNSTAGSISGSGTTTIAAGVTLQASSFAQGGIALQLGGAAPSANSKLNVTGTLSEGGSTFAVSLVNNFRPVTGNSFDLVDWNSHIGAYSDVQLPTLGRIVWDTSQLYTTGKLSVVATYLAGDFNRDGHVDAFDIKPMMMALANIDAYKSTYAPGISTTQLALLEDVNGDGQFNNADL